MNSHSRARWVTALSVFSMVGTLICVSRYGTYTTTYEIDSKQLTKEYLTNNNAESTSKTSKIISVLDPSFVSLISGNNSSNELIKNINHFDEYENAPKETTKPKIKATKSELVSNKIKDEGLDKLEDYFTTVVNDLFSEADLAELQKPLTNAKSRTTQSKVYKDMIQDKMDLITAMKNKIESKNIFDSKNKKTVTEYEKNTVRKSSHGRDHNYDKRKWILEQVKRKTQVKDTCRNYDMNTNMEQLLVKKTHFQNLIVDEEHKLLYCYIPKIACTEWKKTMMVLTGMVKDPNTTKISHTQAHFQSGLINLNSPIYTKDEILYRLRNYKKFMIVRHPLERLLSAFKDKFEQDTQDAANFKSYHGKIMMEASRTKSDIPEDGDGLQFWEFLNYLSLNNPVNFQEHWAQYNQLCHPCIINYDIIGKYETIDVDSNFVLGEIGAPLNVQFPKFNPTKTKKNLSVYLNTVPSHILHKVVEKFTTDFTMFDYDKDI